MLGPECIESPGAHVDAIDTTGAGDVFCGVLTAARAAAAPWRVALAAAVRTAAIAVTRPRRLRLVSERRGNRHDPCRGIREGNS